MFAQLDLFAPPGEAPQKPELKRGRLTPPAIVVLEETNPQVEQEPRLEPFPDRQGSEPISTAEEFSQEPGQAMTMVSEPPMVPESPTVATIAADDAALETATADMAATGLPAKSAETKKGSRDRKSIREMSMEASRVEIPADEQLFSKQYYGIGEVAAMFRVNASLLRFWEAEFDILKPRKNKKGDRFFRPEDIKNLKMIHHLLRERKYTIEGARDFLKKSGRRKEQFEAVESLKKIRAFLLELKAGL